MTEPRTATGKKVVAIYGDALVDDVLGIEAEVVTELRAAFFDLEPTDFTYRDEDPMKPAKRETYVRLDAVLALLAGDKAEAPE